MSLIRSVRFTPLFVQPSPVVKASPSIFPEAQQLTSSLGQSLADSVFSQRLCKIECFTFFSVRPKGNIKKKKMPLCFIERTEKLSS